SNARITSEKNQKDVALREKGTALQAALTSEEDARFHEGLARRRFYAAQMNLAMQAWEQGDSARTLELLEGQRPAFDQHDLRSFEWYYLWRLCHRGLRSRLNHQAENVQSVVFLPDGKTRASAGGESIKLWDVATAQEKAEWQAEDPWGLSVSPDGKMLG